MALKIGIKNEKTSEVVIHTFDNISTVTENDKKHKDHLVHFLKPAYDDSDEEDIDWDDYTIFAYLTNDAEESMTDPTNK